MDKPKSAIEIAREYGVDIEYLRYRRSLTPIERLRSSQQQIRTITRFYDAMKIHADEDVIEMWFFKLAGETR